MTQQTSSQKPLVQRILVIFSGLAFLGTTAFGTASLFIDAFKEPTDSTKTAATAKNTELEAQAKGFESVLQREPDNQVALQGLVQTRIEMNDLPAAIAPMEKLVKLNPDNAEYKVLLKAMKDRAGTAGTPIATPSPKSDRSQKNKK